VPALRSLLRRLEFWLLGNPHDPAWKAQTPDQRFRGYDPQLARRADARAAAKWRRARTKWPVARRRGP